jgi:hypothetical protein
MSTNCTRFSLDRARKWECSPGMTRLALTLLFALLLAGNAVGLYAVLTSRYLLMVFDFHPLWKAARELFLRAGDPYSDAVILMSLLLLPPLAIWAVVQRRWGVFKGLGGALTLLYGTAFLVRPGWAKLVVRPARHGAGVCSTLEIARRAVGTQLSGEWRERWDTRLPSGRSSWPPYRACFWYGGRGCLGSAVGLVWPWSSARFTGSGCGCGPYCAVGADAALPDAVAGAAATAQCAIHPGAEFRQPVRVAGVALARAEPVALSDSAAADRHFRVAVCGTLGQGERMRGCKEP